MRTKFNEVKELALDKYWKVLGAKFKGNKVCLLIPSDWKAVDDDIWTDYWSDYFTGVSVYATEDVLDKIGIIEYDDYFNKEFSRRPTMEFGTKQFANAMETIRQYADTPKELYHVLLTLSDDAFDKSDRHGAMKAKRELIRKAGLGDTPTLSFRSKSEAEKAAKAIKSAGGKLIKSLSIEIMYPSDMKNRKKEVIETLV